MSLTHLLSMRGINQLPAAHKLTASIGHQPLVERWWGESFEPKWTMTKSEVFEQARQLLRSAVKRRLISEVPLGLFLSGGLDSSVIAALMTELSSTPVKTFTIDFIEPIYSESRYARQVAARYRCEHYELVFRPDDVTRVIEDVLSATDEPFADPAALPLFELARQAKQQITVALCGDGGDENSGGLSALCSRTMATPFQSLACDRRFGDYARFIDWFKPSWASDVNDRESFDSTLGQLLFT